LEAKPSSLLAARATDRTWSQSLTALLPPPLSDARLTVAVSSLADPDLALALLSWSQLLTPKFGKESDLWVRFDKESVW
jgi:hypothetical protein